MDDRERFKLHFGPYETPRYRYGGLVMDERLGEVTIVGLWDALIPWPIGRRNGFNAKAIVLYGELATAVQRESNQAVAHWWGVSGQTVTKWRKALSVESSNEGTHQLRSSYALTEPLVKARKKALKKARDADRCAKIAASKQGKKRPKQVIEKLRQANLGRPLSEAHRKKLSEVKKRLRIRPPWLNDPWTAEEDELLRTHSPAQVVTLTERSLSAVYSRRRKLGLPDGRRTKST